MNLAQCANLDVESRALTNEVLREERRRCFWSICLLKRLHGGEFSLDLPEGGGPPFPESSSRPARMLSPVPSTPGVRRSELQDQGIIAYVIMLSEAFARTARYVRLRGRPGNVPPWSPHSEYSKIIALQMNLETRMPLTHRFKPANLGDRSSEELQAVFCQYPEWPAPFRDRVNVGSRPAPTGYQLWLILERLTAFRLSTN